MPLPDKRELYGDNRRPVGGRAPGDEPQANPAGSDGDNDEDDGDEEQVEDQPEEVPAFTKPDGTKLEPVFWWAMPTTYYLELIHSYHAITIIDLSPGSGEFAMASLMNKPTCRYLGVCFEGGHHQAALMDHLTDTYLQGMADQTHAFFTAAYASSIGQAPTDTPVKTTVTRKNVAKSPGKEEEVAEPPAKKRRATPSKNQEKDPDQREEEDEEAADAGGESEAPCSSAAILDAIHS